MSPGSILLIIIVMLSSLVCVGCLLPGKLLPRWLPNDKLLHLGGFFLLMVLISGLTSNLQDTLIYAALLFVAGLLIECLQHIISGRSFCWCDHLANTLGIVLGLGLVVV